VHKAIRRLAPAPKAKVQRRLSEDPYGKHGDLAAMRRDSDSALLDTHKATQTAGTTSVDSPLLSSSPKTATLMMRRSSAGLDGRFVKTAVPVRANFDEIKHHLKHLGPSNPATNPNKTRSTTVKIKPGSGAHSAHPHLASIAGPETEYTPTEEGDETTSLLRPQVSAKDGIQALRQSYGSVSPAVTVQLAPQTSRIPTLRLDSDDQADKATQTPAQLDQTDASPSEASTARGDQTQSPPKQQTAGSSSGDSANSLKTDSTKTDSTLVPKRASVRSGSITENVIESRGVRKVVLEASGSTDEDESAVAVASSPQQPRRTTFGLFARDNKDNKDVKNGKDSSTGEEGGKDAAAAAPAAKSQAQLAPAEEEDEDEELMSPGPGDDEDAPGSYAEAAAVGTSHEGQAGPSSGASGGDGAAGKKKNRRKKRKGGK
jgi:metal transporter CNNM